MFFFFFSFFSCKKNDLEEEDDVDEDDPDMETREPKRIIVAPPLAKGDNVSLDLLLLFFCLAHQK